MIRFRLRQVRQDKGLSQGKLAIAMKMSVQNIQYLEKESKSVPWETLNKLCNKLKCTPADLIHHTPDEPDDESD